MTKELFAELESKVGTLITEKFSEGADEFRAGLITEDQLKTNIETLAKSENIDEVNEKIDQLDAALLEIKKAVEVEKTEKPKSISEQFTEKYKDLMAAKDAGQTNFKLDLKTNVTTASIASDNEGFNLPGFNAPAHLGMVFEQYFQRVPLPANHHGTVYYTDQTTTTRNADTRNEAAAAPESAIAWTRRNIQMEKILDSIPLTHESMLDIAGLTAEVEMFIQNNIRLKKDQQMWAGNNAAPNWAGIYATYATDFTQVIAAGAGVDSVVDANIYDLIASVATYIENGKESKYAVNVAFLNPRDLLKGRVVKDDNGNYVVPPFVSRDGNMVAGTVLVPSAQVTANTMAMGDGRHVRFYDVEGLNLEFGFDSDDFTKDLITLKGRTRGNLLLKTADATAWYKVTDIDQRIVDITA